MAFFIQQRDIEHDQRRIGVFGQKRLAHGAHGRVHDRLEPGQRVAIAEHPRAKRLARHTVGPGGAGKRGLDRAKQRTAGCLQTVYRGVGIEHRHAQRAQHARHRRFAHADRSGQPQHERPGHAVSRARKSLSAVPRGGTAPKKRRNA